MPDHAGFGWFLFIAFGIVNLFWPALGALFWNRVVRADPPLGPGIVRLIGGIFIVMAVGWASFSD